MIGVVCRFSDALDSVIGGNACGIFRRLTANERPREGRRINIARTVTAVFKLFVFVVGIFSVFKNLFLIFIFTFNPAYYIFCKLFYVIGISEKQNK